MYIDNWDDIVNKYNNTYHSTIRMKPVDVKQSTYIEKSFVIKKYVISDLKGEEIVWMFDKKESQKTNKKEFRAEKVIKRKGDKLMLNGKPTIVLLTVGLIKKT